MKKIFLLVCCLAGISMTASATPMPRVVITDCGTVHQIPGGCSDIESAAWQAYWTVIDC